MDYKAAKSTNPNTAVTRKATVTAQVQSVLAMTDIKVTPQINTVISVAAFGMHTVQASASTTA